MHTDIILLDIPSTLRYPVSPTLGKLGTYNRKPRSYCTNFHDLRMSLNIKNLLSRRDGFSQRRSRRRARHSGSDRPAGKPDGSAHYTLPALIDRTNPTRHIAISDSTPIIEYLERTYPAASADNALFPLGTREAQIQFNQVDVMRILRVVPRWQSPAHLASKLEVDREMLREKFEGLYGRPFDQIEKTGAAREALWVNLEQQFKRLGYMIDQIATGSFLMGERPRFMDFALCGAMMFIRCLSPYDGWVRICTWDNGRWERYFDAFSQYRRLGNLETRT